MTRLALIGAGASNLGIVHTLAQAAHDGHRLEADEIDIFDQFNFLGAGLAYNPEASDPHHLFSYKTFAIAIPKYGDFFKFIQQNQVELLAKADDFFEKRLLEKLRLRPGDEEALRPHYERIKQSFRRRYSDFTNNKNYHSRFMLGIFANQLFENAIAQLRASGVRVNLHPATKVTDIKKDQQSGAVEIFFSDKSKKFDRAVVGIGYPFVQGGVESQKYIGNLWPVEAMRQNLQKIIAQEMARREQEGDKTKVIKIAIHGARLSAIDALKSIFVDGYLENDEKGNPRFVALQEGHKLHVDLVMRKNYMVKKVAEANGRPDENLIRLAPVCLAQAMLAKILEPGFANPDKNRFLNFFLKHLGADPDDVDKNLTAALFELEGNEVKKSIDLGKRFKLNFDKVDYEAVFDECSQILGGKTLVDIFVKFYSLPPEFRRQESAEVESFFNLQSYIYGYSAALPPQAFEELRAFAKSGLFGCVVVGDEADLREEKGKLVFKTAAGAIIEYDAVINARGYDMDFANSDSLYSSLHHADFAPQEVGDRRMSISEIADKKIVVVRENEVNIAFKGGAEVATGFYQERPPAMIAASAGGATQLAFKEAASAHHITP